jgi:hypothetical protein
LTQAEVDDVVTSMIKWDFDTTNLSTREAQIVQALLSITYMQHLALVLGLTNQMTHDPGREREEAAAAYVGKVVAHHIPDISLRWEWRETLRKEGA